MAGNQKKLFTCTTRNSFLRRIGFVSLTTPFRKDSPQFREVDQLHSLIIRIWLSSNTTSRSQARDFHSTNANPPGRFAHWNPFIRYLS